MEPKSALPYFYAVKRFRGQSPRYKNGSVNFDQAFMPDKPLWPIHFIFDTAPIARRHSRTGGNPVLNFSELFKDCHHFKLLDSHLRGSNGA